MKKKTLALLLSTALTLTFLSGCGNKTDAPVTEEQEDTTESSTPEIVDIEEEIEEEEEPIVTRPTHYDILPEVANASIADGGVFQIADMVFYDGYRMSADDVKKVVENSQTGAYMRKSTLMTAWVILIHTIPFTMNTALMLLPLWNGNM